MTKANRHTKCPICGMNDVITVDSRHEHEWRMRRKKCFACKHRWTTYEIPADTLGNLMECRKLLDTMREAVTKMGAMLDNSKLMDEISNGEHLRYYVDQRSERQDDR